MVDVACDQGSLGSLAGTCPGQPGFRVDNEAGIKRPPKIPVLGGKSDSLSDAGRQCDW